VMQSNAAKTSDVSGQDRENGGHDAYADPERAASKNADGVPTE
jgi:hypothetical protein